MTLRNTACYAAGLTILAGIAAGSATAQSGAKKVGEIKEPYAWVNKMPPGPPSLHAVGLITAPTPCYEAVTDYAGDLRSNPPVYRIKVTLHQRPGLCPQVLTDIPFRYTQPNYAGNHDRAEIFSDQDSKTIPLVMAQ